MNDNYIARFAFEITDEQKEKADNLIGVYGIRKALFGIILDDILNLIETNGNIVIGAILDGAVKSHEVLPSIAKAKKRISK